MRLFRVLEGTTLPCGCNVGHYEAYDGRTFAIVDCRGSQCADRTHVPNAVLPADAIPGGAPEAPTRAAS
jgi:hypothetical protein